MVERVIEAAEASEGFASAMLLVDEEVVVVVKVAVVVGLRCPVNLKIDVSLGSLHVCTELQDPVP